MLTAVVNNQRPIQEEPAAIVRLERESIGAAGGRVKPAGEDGSYILQLKLPETLCEMEMGCWKGCQVQATAWNEAPVSTAKTPRRTLQDKAAWEGMIA